MPDRPENYVDPLLKAAIVDEYTEGCAAPKPKGFQGSAFSRSFIAQKVYLNARSTAGKPCQNFHNTVGDDSAARVKIARRIKKRSNSLSIAAGVEGDAPTTVALDDLTMYQLPFVHIDVFSTDMTIGELAANIMEKFPMPAIDPSRNINSYSFHMYEILGMISDVSAPGRKEQMFNANRQHGMANQFALQKKELRLAQRNALMKEIRGYIGEYRDR